MLPTELKRVATHHLQRLVDKDKLSCESLSNQTKARLERILGLSEFVAEQLYTHPNWLDDVLQAPIPAPDTYYPELTSQLTDVADEAQVKQILRLYRNKHMAQLATHDFLSLTPLTDLLQNLSVLADALIICARDWLYQQLVNKYGVPTDFDGNAQPLLILGMGKLGGKELNFSSDVDLILVFPEHGETIGGKKSIENQQFFTKMGQKLTNLLEQITEDGFVFRVDLRLRPFGESGPLVVSFTALENYYQEQGRDWERYAMVKARVLGEQSSYSQELQKLLRPFVYRRYIDFSAIEALRKMKQLISREVRRQKLTDNIKLGAGGIREVEFIVQSLQLIRGGREPSLRCQNLLTGIHHLQLLGQLDEQSANELASDYLLLRRVENLLQAIADEQTQTLPENDLNWQRLCYVLTIADEQKLRQLIAKTMTNVHGHFLETVGGRETEDEQPHWASVLWHDPQDDEASALLTKHQLLDDKFCSLLEQWRHHALSSSIGPRGRDTLDRLMPKLLEAVLQHSQPLDALSSIFQVLDKILTRTTYLELLSENVGARQQLISLCCASPWIAEQLSRFPMLLDELIDPTQLYDTTELSDYRDELRQYLLRVPEDDLELQMETLRQFKLSQQLKIAAADITGILPLMQVSDHLSSLAEAIIEQVVHYAWQQVTRRYGTPLHLPELQRGFAVVGYGKLGGMELGYSSDLDLVFLYQSAPDSLTNGDKQIDASHFYLKLAQRILHFFSTRTVSGLLYEVDMRLRPSGSSGMLVSDIDTFADYQVNQAWIWEHQALVRARLILGDAQLTDSFVQTRKQVLAKTRDHDELVSAIFQMRKKMRQHLLKSTTDTFDIKQGHGGITDIEFIAQYFVLAYSHQYPELTGQYDNVRIFETLAELGILPITEKDLLIKAYCYLRSQGHRLTLQGCDTKIALTQLPDDIKQVQLLFEQLFCPKTV